MKAEPAIDKGRRDLIKGASAIAQLLAGQAPQPRELASSCYSLIAPDFALAIAGKYQPHDGQFSEVEGSIMNSPVNPGSALRAQEAKSADVWFATTTGETFG